MFTRDDLLDLLMSRLRRDAPAAGRGAPVASPPTRGRPFLSEYDIKRLPLRDGTLTVPKDAIVSPLAQDWLAFRGIRILRG